MIWFLCFNGIAYSQTNGVLDSLRMPKEVNSNLKPKNYKAICFSSFQDCDKKPLIKVSGQFRVEQRFQNRLAFGQVGPKNYTRFEISPNLQILGLPFRSNIFLTTEQFSGYRGLNRFNLEFDYHSFINQQLSKLKEDIKANNPVKDSINSLNHRLELERSRLTEKQKNLKEPHYEFSDSLHLNHPDIEDSLKRRQDEFYYFYDSINNRLKQIDSTIAYIDSLRKIGVLDEYSNFSDINDPLNLPKKHFKNSRFNSIFSSIKTFQIGSIFPLYHPLFFNGVQLFGANSEFLTRRKWYYSSTIGMSNYVNNSFQDYKNLNTNRGRLGAFQFGKGELTENNIRVGFLTGKGSLNNATSNSTDLFGQNTVLHGAIGIKLSKNIQLRSAYSQSFSRPDYYENIEFDERTITPSNFDNTNSAFSIELENFSDNLNYLIRFQQIGNQFYTLGNPFQRGDLRRIETSAQKSFKKLKTNVRIYLRNDKDNLSQTKAFSNDAYIGRVQFTTKINKNWNINGSFNPSLQFVTTKIESQTSYSNSNYLYQLGSVYQKKFKEKLSYVFTQNFSYLNSINSRGLNINRFFYTAVQFLTFGQNTIQFQSFFSQSEGVFGGKQFNNGVNYSRRIKKMNVFSGVNYNYSNIFLSNYSFNGGIEMAVNKWSYVRIDYKYLGQFNRDNSNIGLGVHSCIIQLIQRF